MSNLPQIIDSVEQKVEKLIAYCDALKKDNTALQEHNQTLQVALNEQENILKELEEKMRILKLAKSFSGENEKTVDIKEKINEFVNEIDRCINLLNR